MAETKMFRLVSTVLQVEQQGLMRRSAVSAVRSLGVFLYQGTMSAQLGNWYRDALSGESVGGLIALARELLWPGGDFMKPGDAWTEESIWGFREELLGRVMHAAMPAAGAVVSKEDLGGAIYRLHFMMHCPAVLQSLIYTLVDLFLRRLLPGIIVHGLPPDPWEHEERSDARRSRRDARARAAAGGNNGVGRGGGPEVRSHGEVAGGTGAGNESGASAWVQGLLGGLFGSS